MGRKYKKAIQDIFRSIERVGQDHNLSSTNACISEGSEFLLTLYKKGLSYSVINNAWSMLSMILPACNGIEFGNTQLSQVCSKEFSGNVLHCQDIWSLTTQTLF